jgi:uncharacterized protein YegP (UPF0339 family)
MSAARFEIVRGDGGEEPDYWWARFVAANGRKVWVTESYERRAGAENAILSIATAFGIIAPKLVENVPGREWFVHSELSLSQSTSVGVHVLFVDERTPKS